VSAGRDERQRFDDAMAAVAVGATLVRRKRPWVVVAQKLRYTSIDLTLRSGRREIIVAVGLAFTGPVLWDADLKVAAPAPAQRGLFGGASA
jgi:hypothetical protein